RCRRCVGNATVTASTAGPYRGQRASPVGSQDLRPRGHGDDRTDAARACAPRAHARRARTRHALATVLAVAGVVPAVLGVGADGGQESALVSDRGETAAGEQAWTVAAGSARWAGDVQAVAPADDTATGVALPAVSGVITENAA